MREKAVPAASPFGLPGFLRSTAPIAAVLLVSLAFVLGLVTLLNYFKFESLLTEITERRIGIVADRVHAAIETALRLGLQLEDIEIAGAVVADARSRYERIEGVYIYRSDQRRTVFASDPAAVGTQADPAWINAAAHAPDGLWRMQAGDRAIVGRRLDSALSRNVGGIVIAYSLADVSARVETMRNRLLSSALLTFAVFSAVSLLIATLVMRGFRHMVADLAAAIDPGGAAASSAAVLPDSLRSSVDHFRDAATAARHQLDEIETALLTTPAGDPDPPARHTGAMR